MTDSAILLSTNLAAKPKAYQKQMEQLGKGMMLPWVSEFVKYPLPSRFQGQGVTGRRKFMLPSQRRFLSMPKFPLFQQLVAFYGALGWDTNKVPDQPLLGITIAATEVQYTLVASTSEEGKIISLFCRPPFACPPEKLATTAMFFARANLTMQDGCWCLDPADGEIRYRMALQCGAIEVTDEVLRRFNKYAMLAFETYWPAVAAFLADGASADEALDRMFA